MDPSEENLKVKSECHTQKNGDAPSQHRNSEHVENHGPSSQRRMIDCGDTHGTDNGYSNEARNTASLSYLQNTFDAATSITGSNSHTKIEESFSRDITDQVPSAGQKMIMAAKSGDLPVIDQLLQQHQGGSGQVISQGHLNDSLMEACKEGRKFIVQKLVRSGAEVNMRSCGTCTTPLHIAVERGFLDIAAFLLNKDADINACDRFENSPLILAVNEAGSSDLIKLLLAYGAHIDHQNLDGVTALMKVVEVKDIDVVRVLMLSRPSFDRKNKLGETVRDIAVRLGITDVFDAAKLEAETRWKSYYVFDSTNVLSKAALMNSTEAVKVLLDCSGLEMEIDWKGPHESKKGNQGAKVSALLVLIESICSDAAESKVSRDAKLDIAKVVIESGINAEKNELERLSQALVDATQSGLYELVEVLCKVKNIEINYLKKSQSALMVAAEVGRLDLLELLLSYGADPKRENHRGEIALTYALANSQIDCANVLLERHKPCERKLQVMARMAVQAHQFESLRFLASHFNLGKISQDLMEKAILTGDSRVVQLLIDHGADINGTRGGGNSALLMALQKGRSYNLPHSKKDCNQLGMVKFLVESGVSVNRVHPNKSPLVTAIENNHNFDVLCYLLDHGADVNEVGDNKGNTPLVATFTKYSTLSCQELPNILEVLLQADADPSKANCDGDTALHLAACTENLRSIKRLIDAGADLEARNSDGMTPLLLAARQGHPEAVKLLKYCGANMKAVDKDGKNAVFQSLLSGFGLQKKTLQLVAIDKDQVNEQLPDGHTPLILAAKHCDVEAIEILLELGADPHKVNGKQKTALGLLLDSFIRRSEAMSGVKMLIRHNALLSLPKHYCLGLYRKIMDDERELVQLMVTHGMAPMCVDFTGMENSLSIERISSSVWHNLSPLAAALVGNRLVIARYLVANWFLTPADLVGSDQLKEIRNSLKSDRTSEIQNYLDEYMSQPMSLVQLSFVAVSAQLGETIGREERVRKTPLPTGLQDRLLFKKELCSIDFIGTEREHSREDSLGLEHFVTDLFSSLVSFNHYSFDDCRGYGENDLFNDFDEDGYNKF